MAKEISVVLVEDDFYARHWMEMLLRRDWRTRVIGEVNSAANLSDKLQDLSQHHERIDLVLIDTDIPHDQNWLSDVLRSMAKNSPQTTILFTGVGPNIQIARMLAQSNFAGYVLKDEIRYALAWAVSLAVEKRIVVTPGICDRIDRSNPLPPGTLILNGCNPIANFSERDAEAARLAFMFSMERRDLADELQISEEYSYGLVSALYEKMGLNDVLKGEAEPEQYFGNHPAVKTHLRQAFETLKRVESRKGTTAKSTSKKIKDKETLAFHLLTLPDIDEIS
jgi:DNA-binding NarL/FixJ family response regulator